MNDTGRSESFRSTKSTGWLASTILILGLLLMAACGGDGNPNGQAGMYPAGSKSDQDLDRELKFDARVESYEADGNKLLVNVNQSFASSPPGIQQRALGRWFGIWQASRTAENAKPQKGLEVVARYEGNDLARWTGDGGFKPAQSAMGKGENEESR